MRKRTLVASIGAAGALTLAGTGIGVALAEPTPTPSPSATAPDESATDAGDERRAAVEEALEGLVEDGTLTQDQVGRVAETLADSPVVGHGWGWHHGHHGDGDGRPDWIDEADVDAAWSAAADALGMTTDELRDALSEPGTSLADVAEQQGVDTQALVDALVAAAQERIDEGVADGSLTEEQAEELRERLPDGISAAVEGGWWSRWGGVDD